MSKSQKYAEDFCTLKLIKDEECIMKENEALDKLFSPIYIAPKISDDTLESIAEGIICHSYIDNGSDTKYIPIEIEFYYHSPRLPFKQDENYEKDHITYPRDIKESCKLLYHYSGIDICFESIECKKARPEFGGIVLLPNAADRADVHRIIYEELCLGEVRPESRARYIAIMLHLVEQGAEAIILGCTEIVMLVGDVDVGVPLFDTTAIHAEAAVAFALGNG